MATSYNTLINLFNDKNKTQLMRETINLLGIRYIKINDLLFLHSYYAQIDSAQIESAQKEFYAINPYFQAAVKVHEVKKTEGGVELTIKALKDEYDAEAIQLIRNLPSKEIETYYSHLSPNYIKPRIEGRSWENWFFAYNVPENEKLSRRQARTRKISAKLFRALSQHNFENKNILFLGCGDGEEIEAFINYLNIKKAKIVGIDQNILAIENCRKCYLSNENISFSFMEMNLNDLSNLKDTFFDLIIAVGILDRETLSFEAGQSILKEINNKLQYEKFITCAYSFELFTSENYQDLGFNVIATSIPQSIFTADDCFYYLMEKSLGEYTNQELIDNIGNESLEFWE